MDWAYVVAFSLGIAVAAGVGLVAAGAIHSVSPGSAALRVGASIIAGVGAGGLIAVVAYWALHPLMVRAGARSP